MTFDELAKVALVGTSRAPLKLSAADDAQLADALAAVAGTAEEQLLGAAAVLSTYQQCGRTTPPAPPPPPAAAEDRSAPCSDRAKELLVALLQMPATIQHHLVGEWLAGAARSAQRVPHVLLPPLLEYAAAQRHSREAVAAVVDRRGQWLMSLNPRWQFSAEADSAQDAADVWSTGNPAQRLSVLQRTRTRNPAAALELIQSTWKEDAAEARAEFLNVLGVALSLEDEPFLEASLDDRSKQVRNVAAALLGRLAGSALVQRMTARADTLLTLHPGAPGGLLRKAKAAQIEVKLPESNLPEDWARDGVVEKASLVLGQRQWWLRQLVQCVPPSHWSDRWQLSPAQCLAAASGDFADLLLGAWSAAAASFRDAAWSEALLRAWIRDRRGNLSVGLLKNLGPAAAPLVTELLASKSLERDVLRELLDAVDFPFDPAMSRLACDQIEKIAASGANTFEITPYLTRLSLRLNPTIAPELEQRWADASWQPHRKALDAFFQTLQQRRIIQTEFPS